MEVEFIEIDGCIRKNKIPIKNLAEYINIIKYVYNISDTGELWFRGSAKSKYKLVPGMYRDGVLSDLAYDSYEYETLSEFQRKAIGLYPNMRNLNKWNWYQTMQHYGLPTRLLDWTESSLISLYFSLRMLSEIEEPCVWVIDFYDLNQDSKGRYLDLYSNIDDKLFKSYLDLNTSPKYPIGIIPELLDGRMIAQRSCFTIHGKAINGLEEFYKKSKDFLYQIVIDDSCAGHIIEELRTSGIKETTLYPDLEGLAREIKWDWFIGEHENLLDID
ncbi:MAG: hypothetical protein C0448_02810 [Sphingobacteriaceae bacterium]|nr:hypothetical protein [Sphingobacteriaceae bacterium]